MISASYGDGSPSPLAVPAGAGGAAGAAPNVVSSTVWKLSGSAVAVVLPARGGGA
jgi:hypothetical protein